MNEEPKITVFYEKGYMDDTGKHIPELFEKNNYDGICIKSYWGNIIDAFMKYNCLFMVTAITGNFRIVIAHENTTGYNFNQFFISGLDGKIIKIPKNTWFGINNLDSSNGAIIMARTGEAGKPEMLDADIFDWYSKR